MLHLSDAASELFQSLRGESRVATYLLGGTTYTTTKEGDYLDVKDGMITYFPTNKAGPDVDVWRVGNRIKGKPGKAARKFLTKLTLERLNDTDFEYFANCIKAGKVIEEAVFEMVEGEAIRYWYNEANHSRTKNIGTLSNSCMKYGHSTSWMDLYVNNPKQIKMLILRDTATNKLLGRALVWFARTNKYMDRIYTSDAARREFVAYARKNGWYIRRFNTYTEAQQWIAPNGKYEALHVEIDLDWVPTSDKYPFLDTFAYISTAKKKISNARFTGWSHFLHGATGTSSVRNN